MFRFQALCSQMILSHKKKKKSKEYFKKNYLAKLKLSTSKLKSRSIGVKAEWGNPPVALLHSFASRQCVLGYLFLPSVPIKRQIKIDRAAAAGAAVHGSPLSSCRRVRSHEELKAESISSGGSRSCETRGVKLFSSPALRANLRQSVCTQRKWNSCLDDDPGTTQAASAH